jgi:hypothetical protein
MDYRIYNSDLTAYSLEGWMCPDSYERDKKYHLKEGSTHYGDKLVRMKRVLSGITFRWAFYWKNYFELKPQFHWRYGVRYFHWFCFMLWIENNYVDEIDCVIKDHLAESRAVGEKI